MRALPYEQLLLRHEQILTGLRWGPKTWGPDQNKHKQTINKTRTTASLLLCKVLGFPPTLAPPLHHSFFPYYPHTLILIFLPYFKCFTDCTPPYTQTKMFHISSPSDSHPTTLPSVPDTSAKGPFGCHGQHLCFSYTDLLQWQLKILWIY